MTASSSPHVLPADLSLAAAPALKDALGAALAAQPACRIDGGAVSVVSTAAIQILLAAVRRHAVLAVRSPALDQAIADLGLTDDFTPHGEANG